MSAVSSTKSAIWSARTAWSGCATHRFEPIQNQRKEFHILKAKRTKESAPATPSTGSRKVRLQYHAPDAQRVCVAGSFNRWQPEAGVLRLEADGLWHIESELEPGAHECRFVVDGVWCDDPQAAQTLPNPFGGCNAVLLVATAN
jgi:1,4-alpha-glucan branching enzyme